MRKELTNDLRANIGSLNHFKEIKNLSPKNPRYIYTEEDLGEGILDVGIIYPALRGQQGNLNPGHWASMLRTSRA